MGSFVISHVHVVFGTKFREPLIEPHFEDRLHRYISGIAKKIGVPLIISGGMSDHVHILLLQPGNMTIAVIVKHLKGNSSKWINDTFYPDRRFKWQGGYAAFGVSLSQVEMVKKYIKNQKTHHRSYGFEEEYKLLMLRHNYKIPPS